MPPEQALPADQLQLIEALKQRNLLASGGNLRAVPFTGAGSGAVASESGVGGNSNPSGSTDAPRPAGPTPIIKDNQLIDPTTQAPMTGPAADDWWKYLLAGAGIAGGSVLADMLRRRNGGKVPTVEGEVIDPLAPVDDRVPVEGEYTEVPEPKQLTQMPAAIEGEDTVTRALADRQKAITARNMPQPNPVPVNDTSVVRGKDAMTDISPEEIENAKALVQQLIAQRTKGNANPKIAPKKGLPTGPVEPPEPDSLLNTIIRLMRESGATRVIPRAI